MRVQEDYEAYVPWEPGSSKPPVKPEPPAMRIGDAKWRQITDAIADGFAYKGAATSRAAALALTVEQRQAQDEFSEITSVMARENIDDWRQYEIASGRYAADMASWRTQEQSRSEDGQARQVEIEADLLLDPATPNSVRADLAKKPAVLAAIRHRALSQ